MIKNWATLIPIIHYVDQMTYLCFLFQDDGPKDDNNEGGNDLCRSNCPLHITFSFIQIESQLPTK